MSTCFQNYLQILPEVVRVKFATAQTSNYKSGTVAEIGSVKKGFWARIIFLAAQTARPRSNEGRCKVPRGSCSARRVGSPEPRQEGPADWQLTGQSWRLPPGGQALPWRAGTESRQSRAEQLQAATCGWHQGWLPLPPSVRNLWPWLGLSKCIVRDRTSLLALGWVKPRPGQQQPGPRTACSSHQSRRPWEAGQPPKTQGAAGECVALGQ